MKKIKVLATLLVLSILFTSISFNIFAESKQPNNFEPTFYLTEKENGDLKVKNLENKEKNVKVVNPKNIESELRIDNVNLWVDNSLLNDSKVKDKLEKVYKNGGRIIIRGGDLNRKDVRKYFGINQDNKPEIIENPLGSSAVSVGTNNETIGNKKVGYLIYQQDGVNNVTSIYENNNDSSEEIEKVFLYANQYDYIGLAEGNQTQNSHYFALSSGEAKAAEISDWKSVDIDTRTDSSTRLYINLALTLVKNGGNPNNNGQYLYSSDFRADIDTRGDNSGTSGYYAIASTRLGNAGKSGSKVFQYAPLDRSWSGSQVTASLPYGISLSFNPETMISISLFSGGLNQSSINVDFNVCGVLGTQNYAPNMWCETAYEAYQNSSSFSSTASYGIQTYEFVPDGASSFTRTNGVYYTMGTSFVVSGT